MTWDIRGRYKPDIASYEKSNYDFNKVMGYLYSFMILALDVVVVIFFTTKLILAKLTLFYRKRRSL